MTRELLVCVVNKGEHSVTLTTGNDPTILGDQEAVVRIQNVADPEWIEQFQVGERYLMSLADLTE